MTAEFQETLTRIGDFAGEFSAARHAQARWAKRPVRERIRLIRRVRALIAQNARSLAEASVFPRSRPLHEALTAEVLPLIESCRFLEKSAKRILAPRRLRASGALRWLGHAQTEIRREPYGLVLIIGPGNYPLLLPGVQLLQALCAGNAVVVKPGVSGTATIRVLRDLLIKAGLNSDLLTILPESTEAVRAAIEGGADKVLFTGSAKVGTAILELLTPRLIPSTMELSGSDAVVVCADADLELVAKAVAFGLTLNGGATCMSPKRLFVERSVATELEGRLAQLKLPLHETSNGPVAAIIQQTLSEGAHLVSGRITGQHMVELPLIVAGVSPGAQILREDLFAPVLALVTVANPHEAVERANDCSFALGASVFSRDEEKATGLASEIDAGIVTINDLILPSADPRIPFGGRKRSGFGVTRGAEGLLDLTRSKVITFSRGQTRRAFDPPASGQAELFESFIRMAHGGEPRSRFAAMYFFLRTLLRHLRKD